MDPARPLLSELSAAVLGPLTSSEIRANSVLQVTNPQLLDRQNVPTSRGLYDGRLILVAHCKDAFPNGWQRIPLSSLP